MGNSIVAIVLDYKATEQVNECIKMLDGFDIFESIVVVDNSCDFNSTKYLTETKCSINVIQNSSNIGFGPALNKGIEYAFGHYSPKTIVFINYDIKIEKETVLLCNKYVDYKHPVVSCLMRTPEGSIDQSYWDQMLYKDFIRLLFYRSSVKVIDKRKRIAISDYDHNSNRAIEANSVRESFMVVDANYIKEVKPLFSEKMFMYGEADYVGHVLSTKEKKCRVLLDCSYYHYHIYLNNKKYKSNNSFVKSSIYLLQTCHDIKGLRILLFRVLSFFAELERLSIFLLVKIKNHGK